MTHAHQFLYEAITKLPLEKIDKALSFIRYLEQEPELELLLNPVEETELHNLLASNEVVDASEVLAKIMVLPND